MPAQTAPLRADLEQVSRGAGSQFFSFSAFGGARVKLRESTTGHIRATYVLGPGEFIPVPASRDRSASVRVWIGFGSISGRPKSLTAWAFSNGLARNIDYFLKFKAIELRDRFGSRLDRERAKNNLLPIFNLHGQPTSVRFSVNQWVPGSSPGRGAKFSYLINC
jgi:hypothetical protein